MTWVKDGFMKNIKEGDIGGLLGNVGEAAVREFTGLDDFYRMLKYAGQGDWMKAAKSLGAGAFELGSTIIPAGELLKLGKAGQAVGKSAIVAPELVDKALATATEKGVFNLGKAKRLAELAQVAEGTRNVGGQERLASGLLRRVGVLTPAGEFTRFGRPALQAFRAGEIAQIPGGIAVGMRDASKQAAEDYAKRAAKAQALMDILSGAAPGISTVPSMISGGY